MAMTSHRCRANGCSAEHRLYDPMTRSARNACAKSLTHTEAAVEQREKALRQAKPVMPAIEPRVRSRLGSVRVAISVRTASTFAEKAAAPRRA